MSATGTRQIQVDTREKILDAAELLFAREGLSRPSVRQITAEAGVNVAAVNYHFGSREGLVEAVFERHAADVNTERLEQLDKVLHNASDGRPSLAGILEAYLEVRLRRGEQRAPEAPALTQLFGQLLAEPPEVVQPLMQKHFAPTTERFLDALGKALPELPRSELEFRFRLVVASLAATSSHNQSLHIPPNTESEPMEYAHTVKRLVAFLSAGLRAPHEVNR